MGVEVGKSPRCSENTDRRRNPSSVRGLWDPPWWRGGKA